jgi:multidrug efflux pump subunit AcrB
LLNVAVICHGHRAVPLRYQHTFYVLALLVLFLGGSAIIATPKDVFPSINVPVVTVIWQYTGLTPEEMDQRVTTYSEYAISTSVGDSRNIESQTLSGISVEKIFFQPNVNVDLAISQIVSASNFIRALMPAGIQSPVIVQFNASSVPVLQLSLSSDRLNEQQLYDYGIYQMRQALAPIPGITLPRLTAASTARSWSISTLMHFGHTASRRTTRSPPSTHRA